MNRSSPWATKTQTRNLNFHHQLYFQHRWDQSRLMPVKPNIFISHLKTKEFQVRKVYSYVTSSPLSYFRISSLTFIVPAPGNYMSILRFVANRISRKTRLTSVKISELHLDTLPDKLTSVNCVCSVISLNENLLTKT